MDYSYSSWFDVAAFIFQKPLHLENATIAMAVCLILVFIGSQKGGNNYSQ